MRERRDVFGSFASDARLPVPFRSRRVTSMAKSGQCSSQMRHWLQSSGRAMIGEPSLSRSNTLSGHSSMQTPQALQSSRSSWSGDTLLFGIALIALAGSQSCPTMGRSMSDSLAFSMASGYPASA